MGTFSLHIFSQAPKILLAASFHTAAFLSCRKTEMYCGNHTSFSYIKISQGLVALTKKGVSLTRPT